MGGVGVSGLFAAPGLAETVYEILRTDDREETRALRARMEEMWEVFEPYADPHFLIEFRTRLNARYWEMYLARAFIGAGYRVMSDPSGPDLCLTYDGQRIWVEAVEATQGAEGSPDRTPNFGDDSVVDYPEEQVLLRLRNAIDAKRAKRETYLESGLVTPADAYVIAINAGRIPYAFGMEDPPRILNAVYPIGALQIHIRSSDGEVVGVDNAYRPFRLEGKRQQCEHRRLPRCCLLGDQWCHLLGKQCLEHACGCRHRHGSRSQPAGCRASAEGLVSVRA